MNLIPKNELPERLYNARKKMRYSYAKTKEITGLPIQTLFNVEKKLHPNVTLGTQQILSEFIAYAENEYIEPTKIVRKWDKRNEF